MAPLDGVGSSVDGYQAGRGVPALECGDSFVADDVRSSTPYQEDRALEAGQRRLEGLRGVVAVVPLPRVPSPFPGAIGHFFGVVDHAATQRSGAAARVVRNRSLEGLFEA